MDNIQQFARECDDFIKKSLLTPNVKPKDVDLRIDVMIALLERDTKGMGTLGPGSPHQGLLHYLENRHLPAEVKVAIDGS